MTKKLSQFGHNVWKYRLVNAVAVNFNTNETNEQNVSAKNQAGNYIDTAFKHVSLSNKSIYPWFSLYYLRAIKGGLDNSECGIHYDLMTRFVIYHILLHH